MDSMLKAMWLEGDICSEKRMPDFFETKQSVKWDLFTSLGHKSFSIIWLQWVCDEEALDSSGCISGPMSIKLFTVWAAILLVQSLLSILCLMGWSIALLS